LCSVPDRIVREMQMSLQKAKEYYWELRKECTDLYLRFVMSVPCRLGAKLRDLLLPSQLGGMGENNYIQDSLFVSDPKKFFIGNNCHIARRVTITAGGGVRLGDWVGIGPDAKIWSVNHRYSDPDTPYILQGWDYAEVVIGDDVWIGANAFIMPGVRIGKGAIISAGTVLVRSVPDYAVVAGNPGRIMGWRKKPEQQAANLDNVAHIVNH
jgi:acetyltransferase-like isoleucine patch superfamily enzyme